MSSSATDRAPPPAVDPRRYPRVLVQEDVHIERAAADRICARISDVSPDGFQVMCDRDTMRNIVPPGALGADAKSPSVRARLTLPLADGRETIDVECQVTYMGPGEDTQFALGLRFLSMSARSASVLQEFIEESLTPS